MRITRNNLNVNDGVNVGNKVIGMKYGNEGSVGNEGNERNEDNLENSGKCGE